MKWEDCYIGVEKDKYPGVTGKEEKKWFEEYGRYNGGLCNNKELPGYPSCVVPHVYTL